MFPSFRPAPEERKDKSNEMWKLDKHQHSPPLDINFDLVRVVESTADSNADTLPF